MLLGGKRSCFELESLRPTKFRLASVPRQIVQVQSMDRTLSLYPARSVVPLSKSLPTTRRSEFQILIPRGIPGHNGESATALVALSHMKLAVDGVVQSKVN